MVGLLGQSFWVGHDYELTDDCELAKVGLGDSPEEFEQGLTQRSVRGLPMGSELRAWLLRI